MTNLDRYTFKQEKKLFPLLTERELDSSVDRLKKLIIKAKKLEHKKQLIGLLHLRREEIKSESENWTEFLKGKICKLALVELYRKGKLTRLTTHSGIVVYDTDIYSILKTVKKILDTIAQKQIKGV